MYLKVLGPAVGVTLGLMYKGTSVSWSLITITTDNILPSVETGEKDFISLEKYNLNLTDLTLSPTMEMTRTDMSPEIGMSPVLM